MRMFSCPPPTLQMSSTSAPRSAALACTVMSARSVGIKSPPLPSECCCKKCRSSKFARTLHATNLVLPSMQQWTRWLITFFWMCGPASGTSWPAVRPRQPRRSSSRLSLEFLPLPSPPVQSLIDRTLCRAPGCGWLRSTRVLGGCLASGRQRATGCAPSENHD